MESSRQKKLEWKQTQSNGNGASTLHYDLPFFGASGLHYDYGSYVNPSGPYGPLHIPTSYGHGVVIGPGPRYGVAPLLHRYGMRMPLGHGPLGLRPGVVPDDNGSRKRRGDGLSDGDWVCPKCGNTNFASRTICNIRRCSTSKPTEHNAKSSSGAVKNSSKAPPNGSWTCEKCGNVNYPFRTKCNRANCGVEKPSDKNDSPKSHDDDDDDQV